MSRDADVLDPFDPHRPSPADVAVLRSTHQAAAALDPLRLRILAHLRHPDSASGTARSLHSPRQRIGYHIRQLTQVGLLRPAGERRSGNAVEQLLQTTATQYFLGPHALGPVALNPAMAQDHLSSTYQIATAYRAMLDVSELQKRAHSSAKKLPTLTLESELSFESTAEQSAFASELTEHIKTLSAKYAASNTSTSRKFRIVTMSHPAIDRSTDSTLPEQP